MGKIDFLLAGCRRRLDELEMAFKTHGADSEKTTDAMENYDCIHSELFFELHKAIEGK